MKYYIKQYNGKWIRKTAKDIIITSEEAITYNPSEKMILADGWILDTESDNSTDIDILSDIKRQKIWEVSNYNKSKKINGFYLQNKLMFLDKNKRVNLMLRFQSEQYSGKTKTTLWYDGTPYTLNLTDAIDMLYALENYAATCYDVTQFHISQISELKSKEDVDSYDFTLNYPDNLYFEWGEEL